MVKQNIIYAKNNNQWVSGKNTAYVNTNNQWVSGVSWYNNISAPMAWNISELYRRNILNALNYIKTYKTEHKGSYAICQFNDIHGFAAAQYIDITTYSTPTGSSLPENIVPNLGFKGNEPNFINYFGNDVIDMILFNGDIATVATTTEYPAALSYMQGAQSLKTLFIMGNHEYGWYKDGIHTGDAYNVEDPEIYFKPIINLNVKYSGLKNEENHDALIYYYDDKTYNVRYIVLNYYYITRRVNDENYPNESCHKLDTAQLEWLGETLANSGNKDIIIAGHCNLNPFNLVPSGTQTSTPDNGLDGQTDLVNMIKAFKNRSSSYSAGSKTFNFSNTTGNFIMYTSGHYHSLGYVNGTNGFNAFIGPSLNRPTKTDKKYAILIYIINPLLNKIILIQCRRDNSGINDEIYEYTY